MKQDAHILGRILSDDQVTLTNIEDALTIYDAIRRPFGNGVVEKSRMTGFMYEFNVQGYEESNNLSEDDLKDLGKLIDEQWCWQWETLPDKEWEETESRLAELQSIQRIYKSCHSREARDEPPISQSTRRTAQKVTSYSLGWCL